MPPSFQVPKKIAAVSGSGREDDRDAVPLGDPVVAQEVRRLVGRDPAARPSSSSRLVAVVALPDHRRLVARMLVADVGGDVVALGHVPLVLRAYVLVGPHAVTVPSGVNSDAKGGMHE